MSTITILPTTSLRPDDTLLVDGSMVSVDSIELDEFDDGHWLCATCISGNFNQWESPRFVDAEAEWQVLNANRDPAGGELA